jgi:hypothetical protein
MRAAHAMGHGPAAFPRRTIPRRAPPEIKRLPFRFDRSGGERALRLSPPAMPNRCEGIRSVVLRSGSRTLELRVASSPRPPKDTPSRCASRWDAGPDPVPDCQTPLTQARPSVRRPVREASPEGSNLSPRPACAGIRAIWVQRRARRPSIRMRRRQNRARAVWRLK